jgi:hypothetical protein
MFSALEPLTKGQCAPLSLALAKTISFYWKYHFANPPIFTQIMPLLRARGTEQYGWFGSRSSRWKSIAFMTDFSSIALIPVGIIGNIRDPTIITMLRVLAPRSPKAECPSAFVYLPELMSRDQLIPPTNHIT